MTAIPATRSTVTVRSLSVSAYVGLPPNRRRVSSRQAITVGIVRSQVGMMTRNRHQASQAHHSSVSRPPITRTLAPVELEPHAGLGDPGPEDPPVAGRVRPLDLGDRTPGRPLRAVEAQRAELLVDDVGADPAVAALDPLLELGEVRIEDLVTAHRVRRRPGLARAAGHTGRPSSASSR